MCPSLQLNQPLVKCRCGKYFSPTRKEAEKMCDHVARLKGGTNPVRYYQCQFNGWHWTSDLNPIKTCTNCHGRFRPGEENQRQKICDVCIPVLAEKEAARIRRRKEKAAAEEAARAAERDRIIRETKPTPAILAQLKRKPVQ